MYVQLFVRLFQVFSKNITFSFNYTMHMCMQVLTLYDSVSEIDVDGVVRYVASLQQPDGSFIGNKWG